MSRVACCAVSILLIAISMAPAAESGTAASQMHPRPQAKMRGVGVGDVRWTDGFWAERWELCRREMLPSVERALSDPANSE